MYATFAFIPKQASRQRVLILQFCACSSGSILSLPQPLNFILAATSRFYPCRSLSILSLPQPLDFIFAATSRLELH